jgi:hypothetical protein
MRRRVMKELGITSSGLPYVRRLDRMYRRVVREYLREEQAMVEPPSLPEIEGLSELIYRAHVAVRRAHEALLKGRLDDADRLLKDARLTLSTILPP